LARSSARPTSPTPRRLQHVEADEVGLVELLAAAKLLDPMVDHGRSEIERATERLIELIAAA
jgi:hypothetical protein